MYFLWVGLASGSHDVACVCGVEGDLCTMYANSQLRLFGDGNPGYATMEARVEWCAKWGLYDGLEVRHRLRGEHWVLLPV
jgi:hypothetical protein